MCSTGVGFSLQSGVNHPQDINKSFAMVTQVLKKLHCKDIVSVMCQGPIKQYLVGGEMPKSLLCISVDWNVTLSTLMFGLLHLI